MLTRCRVARSVLSLVVAAVLPCTGLDEEIGEHMRTFGTSLSVGLGALLLAGNAFAQAQCETSDDCEAGMVCEIVGSSGCAGAPDCAEGADCEPAPACEPMDVSGLSSVRPSGGAGVDQWSPGTRHFADSSHLSPRP